MSDIEREMRYVVNEHFAAFQGEGVHAGKPAYFVRLHGCDQKCHFCDSAGTWHPDFKTPHPTYTGKELASLVYECVGKAFGGAKPFVVITGGEPTLYNCEALVDELHNCGFRVHLETAGHRVIRGKFDWVTLSPKTFAKPPIASSMACAHEFKIIVESRERMNAEIALIAEFLKGAAPRFQNPHAMPSVWLHPEWSKRGDPEVLQAIIDAVKTSPLNVRAGFQLHKLYSVDQQDPNSDKRLIPLGGKP